MQLTSTTDYAIRIVCYLAAQRQMISTSELSQELSVPSSYIPKITKKLKQAGIIKAYEGTNGGYMLAKQPENISLMDIISCVEETMAINRCLEEDRFCSRNLEDTCKIHKKLLSLQNTYNNKLESMNTFFHIFNHLFRNGKRIILASDRPPVELKDMPADICQLFSSPVCLFRRPVLPT